VRKERMTELEWKIGGGEWTDSQLKPKVREARVRDYIVGMGKEEND